MIPLFKVYMSPKVGPELLNTLYSGYITQGPKVDQFEYNLKNWLDVRYLATTNSGTNALQLALYLSGVRHKSKVISTPMTCSATNTAIRAVGGDIVWADIDPETGNIDPNSVEDLLKKDRANSFNRIKTVMIVHWGGYPCDLTAFNFLSNKYGVKIIEDAAHAFGARYHRQSIGIHSDFVCYSFQAIKHLTTIDGGAVVCRELGDYSRAKLLRWFGIDREAPRKDFRCEGDIPESGFKYHMNDVNATVGIYNLEDMDKVVGIHTMNGIHYDLGLKNIPNITLLRRDKGHESSYWIYTLLVNNRSRFMELMLERGIQTSQVHARNDLHTMFAEYKVPLPGVDAFTARQVNIPVGWWVTKEQTQEIVNTIKEIAGSL